MSTFNRIALILVTLIIIMLPLSQSSAQNDDSTRDARFTQAAKDESAKRDTAIRKELTQLKNDEWAGEYYYGDGLGTNVSLIFAPTTGFNFVWHGCLGVYDRNYGSISITDKTIKLSPTFPNARKDFQGIDLEFYKVAWGERHYLIAKDQVIEFCNAINAGDEPVAQLPFNRFLMKAGDKAREAKGKPNIPAEFNKYLLAKPINANIIQILDSRVEKDNDFINRFSKVIINAGKEEGVLPGMKFRVTQGYDSLRVNKVDAHTSEAVLVQIVTSPEAEPKVNWSVSTRVE